MNNSTNQKEVLLVVNTSFFSKTWLKRNETAADKNFTQKEKIIDACWNGLVAEILPECFDTTDKSLTLWQVNDADAFIDLEFCTAVEEKEKDLSVNPHLFMQVQTYN